jgi:hypothetical protein
MGAYQNRNDQYSRVNLPVWYRGYERKFESKSDEAFFSVFIIIIIIIIIIWFVRLLALRPLLAYCASLGW